MALALLLHGQKSLFGFENGHMKQKSLHKVYINSAKLWGIKIEIYLTAEVLMGINIDQSGVQRNRYQMTPSNEQPHYTRSMIYKGNPKMVQYWITISYDVTVMK